MNDYNLIYAYERKSPDDKEDTIRSINNQKELNEGIAKRIFKFKGEVKHFFDENISGGDRFRKGFISMISEIIEINETNPNLKILIIVKDQERFARDSAFFQDTLNDLNARGIEVFSVIKQGMLSTNDLGDTVGSLLSEKLIKDGRKKAEILIDSKISKNLPCIPAPFGYKYNKQKSWSIIKKESEIILGVIRNYLNSIDYGVTMKDFNISRGKYDRIIKNTLKGLYSGFCFFNRKYKASGKIVRTQEIKYKINVEPIISEELFNQVNLHRK